MSLRDDLWTLLLAKVNTSISGVTAVRWEGDPNAITAATSGSQVLVRYLAMNCSEPREIGGKARQREFYFEIAVVGTGTASTALGLLENIESGLFGYRLQAGVGRLKMVRHPESNFPENNITNQLGKTGYIQCWVVPDVTI